MTAQKPKKSNPIPIVLALVLGILATSLVFQNNKIIEIKLWFWQIRSSFVLIMGIAFLLGLLLALLPMWGRLARRKRELKQCKKEMNKLQARLKEQAGRKKEMETPPNTD